MHISVNVIKVLDKSWLVAVSKEQSGQFSVIHTSVNCSLANFEAIDMHYWQDRAGLFRVDILCGVPAPVYMVVKIYSYLVNQKNLTWL